MAMKTYRNAVVMLPMLLIAGFAAGLLVFALDASDAETPGQAAVAIPHDSSEVPPEVAALQPSAAEPAVASLDHLRIVRQSFRRGGLGSKALITFTLRNDNDYAVKDPEILCSFRSRDGRYATERRRTINETLNPKSRKAFPLTLIGFVNIRASRAKCSLVTASRG